MAQVNFQMQHQLLHQPQPVYTCPSCRAEVKTRPAEEYALKALIRTIASVHGEQCPEKPGMVGRIGIVPRDAPWDRFFGRATKLPARP